MWRFVGHPGPLNLLGHSIKKDRLAHAYLVTGPPHVGKTTLALDLAAAVNCEEASPPCGECPQCLHVWGSRHADIQLLGVAEEEGQKVIKIDAIRDVAHQAHLNPFEGRSRVIIIESAEHLSDEAANALLKLLEEPPPHLLLLLLTASPDQILATIHSRCQRIDLHPLSTEQVTEALTTKWEVPDKDASALANLSNGCIGWAAEAWVDSSIMETRDRRLQRLTTAVSAGLEERFAYAAEIAGLLPQQRTAVRETLDLWAKWWRDLLITKANISAGVDAESSTTEPTTTTLLTVVGQILRTQELLDMNVNPRLALEALMLSWPRIPEDGYE
ncbi:MAG: DNA polymerase III subunit delta' [Chloroflexota bacterium]|nr:DNA polymerase III subunit delta' [Chloroflexota bacterium]